MPLVFDPDIKKHVNKTCPPTTAIPADGVFFRHVMSFPCKDSDFDSDIKTNKTPPRPIDDCDSWGCSVFDNIESVEKLKSRARFFRKNGLFVKVHLNPQHGSVDNGSGHRSFWKYVNANVSQFCEAI